MRSIRALLFSYRAELAQVRDENNKARSSRPCGSKAFSLGCYSQWIKPNEMRRNPPVYLPSLLKKGQTPVLIKGLV